MPIDEGPAANGQKLRSLNLVLDILEAIHLSEHAPGVTEVARAVDTSKGAVHGILANLEARGYVRRTPDKRYQLGIKLWELGYSAEKDTGLRDAARPYLRRLTEATGESTHLSVYDAGEVLYLDKVTTPHSVQAYSAVGGRAPAHCVATGKAMLAHQDPAEIARVLRSLHRYTERTITDPALMTEALTRVRQHGYALNAGEWRIDVAGVAAPITGFSGAVLGAIGISGPIFRLTPEAAAASIPHVVAAAENVSRLLRGASRDRPTTQPRSDAS